MAQEFGWVIERGDSPIHTPKYWHGSGWSDDNLLAIRFARNLDAERVRDQIAPNVPEHRVCEHGWTDFMALDPAIKLQRAEERLCKCGAAGSGEGHAPECPAAKFDHIPRNMTATNALKRLGIK